MNSGKHRLSQKGQYHQSRGLLTRARGMIGTYRPNISASFSIHLDTSGEISRRPYPTTDDVSAAAVIFKIRRQQNNSDIDVFCDLINAFNVSNAPKSWQSIKRNMKLDVSSHWYCAQICNACGAKTNGASRDVCQACSSDSLIPFYHYPIAEQIQHLLLMPSIYSRMKRQRQVYMENLRDTIYGQILLKEPDISFTMTINSDGIVTKNKHISLWPITLIINEIPLPSRRYSESIVLGGVVSTAKHPSNKLFQTMLDLVHEQCSQLESGRKYYIPDECEQRLKFFLIGSCTDKPAQSLLANMVSYNANFSCSKCLIKGCLLILFAT